MNTSICTLFEGNYHHGLAALTNSLYKNGFRGNVYAGYRGTLPNWSKSAIRCKIGEWENSSILNVASGINIVFIPLVTEYHLTNFKPDFMLELLAGPEKDSDAIFYFDPDICTVAPWSFFEKWIDYGVALCEDVNSPLPKHHPRRSGWREYFSKYNFVLKFRGTEYVNGGFIGVARRDFSFIELWQKLQLSMADDIGGLSASSLDKSIASRGIDNINYYMFNKTDQDALNAAIEAYDAPTSIIGKEAMTFGQGQRAMSHALGQPKPWQNNYIVSVLMGEPLDLRHKDYWHYCNQPIKTHSKLKCTSINFLLKISKLTSRLYGRR